MQVVTYVATIWGEHMKKRYAAIVACYLLLISIILTGCPNPYHYKNHPMQQPGTTWVSKDGSIEFVIGSEAAPYPAYGVMQTEEGPVELAFRISPQITFSEIHFANDYKALEEGEPEQSFACGEGVVKREDKFVLTITEAECLFESGQKIVFYRVDSPES